MSIRRPRAVVGAAVMLLVLVLGLFALALAQSHADDRRDAERGFGERTRVSAALTESLFSSTAAQAAAQNARRLGGRTLDEGDLERQVREASLAYAAVLDGRGRVLATTRDLPPQARTRLTARSTPVREALAGRLFLSDFIDMRGTRGVLEYAAPFKTRYGARVLVQGFSATLIARFFGGYLGRIPDARRSTAYVLDSNGRVVGSPSARQPSGSTVREPGLVSALRGGARSGEFHSAGTTRSFASAPVAGTAWRVVLSTRSSTLYAGTGATVQWLILLALGAAGAAAVFLFGRTLRAAANVERANAARDPRPREPHARDHAHGDVRPRGRHPRHGARRRRLPRQGPHRRGEPRALDPLRDHAPAGAARPGGVRGALRAGDGGRERRAVGLGPEERRAVPVGALDGDARVPRG